MISAGGNTYTYNVEDVRVRNLCGESETTYAYNTNGRLSQLLVKTTDGVVTKYVYGLGLIGEETSGSFKTYHFDYRGSTTAITDINGNVTDTFTYDTYGNLISRTGTSVVIFLYNGEYGVVTDTNGLLYMRARYYSPELRRFVNADILMGDINNSSTLNRYAYANGNPISNIDPFGLAADESRGGMTIAPAPIHPTDIPYDILQQILAVHNRKNTSFFYSDDYEKDATIKVDEKGNITYIFMSYNKHLIADTYISTHYYFEVQEAQYWQEQLDFKINDNAKLIFNDVADKINGTLEFLTPPGGPFEKLEFFAGLFQITTSGLSDLLEDNIVHNTNASAYLFDKVVGKEPTEQVAILRSAVTYEGTKYKWQDYFDREKTAERKLI